MTEIWQKPQIIAWSQIILDSYKKLLGHELIERNGDELNQAKNLFLAPFVVYSHNTDPDPIYNYGNEQGLKLWEMDWQELIRTPSRTTTQPSFREERKQFLAQTTMKGYITDYQGIRISKKGTKYQIDNVTVWNLRDSHGEYCGQAATFSQWKIIS
jgi:hypothetical protein